MGLLDSVLGAVSNPSPPEDRPGGGAGLGALGGLGGLIGLATSHPQLLQAVAGLLGNDGEHGGLGGLMSKFQQAGLGDVAHSWVGTGANQPVSGEQLTEVLGSDTLSQLGAKLGVGQGEAATQLSQVLPGLIDHLTPNGQAPAEGLGNAGDLLGRLGSLLRK
ncbi:YidB family protein [Acidovorax sp. SRB_24]|uniref:YidB family protein n=1 Tax=Acidovorax sp. SRB_24 TaxID=1962700 RepID=UPI00145D04BD|nr:YidB family protein [Acidovorax sp. SRB_24]NMM78253.1 hypothetical protein [Acidovorax sp. SRB_24]